MNLNVMDPKVIALAVAVLVIIVVVALALYMRKRTKNTAELRDRFGPEYDRAVQTHGSELEAEGRAEKNAGKVQGWVGKVKKAVGG